MDLTDYPNLRAIFDGQVSRAHSEWPQVRVELRQLLNAATARERLLVDQKALTENAWKVANDQARQREAMERRVEAFEQLQQAVSVLSANIARLEEEKAQALEGEHYYRATGNMWAERCAQAEVREAEMRRVLDVFWRDRVKLNLPSDYQAMLPEVLSPDAGRAAPQEPPHDGE